MAIKLVGNPAKVHFSFPNWSTSSRQAPIDTPGRIIELNPQSPTQQEKHQLEKLILSENIDIVFGFDQPATSPIYSVIRKCGVKLLLSYWGAPMSSRNRGFKLTLKRLEIALRRHGPDLYIFESKSMQDSAIYGRGIAARKTCVVRLGVDTHKYKYRPSLSNYAFDEFSIPQNRKIIYYSGHMESRKGVNVLISAAKQLYTVHQRRDFHFLILGNLKGQEAPFLETLREHSAIQHVTFGGYRSDIPAILCSAYVGAIASTGWDSFTVSSLEMASSGLPLLVSDLQGLSETVENEKTGYLFPPGSHETLALLIARLLDDPELRNRMGRAARERIVNSYSVERQVDELSAAIHLAEQRLATP